MSKCIFILRSGLVAGNRTKLQKMWEPNPRNFPSTRSGQINQAFYLSFPTEPCGRNKISHFFVDRLAGVKTSCKTLQDQGMPGRTWDPWQSEFPLTCHTKEPETNGREGIHPSSWQCILSTPISEKKRKPTDTRPYIRSLSNACYSLPARHKRRRSRDARGVI